MVQSLFNKITNRILLGYSIPLLFLLGSSVIVYQSTNRVFRLQQESDRIQQDIRQTNAFVDGLNRMIGAARGYVIFPRDQDFKSAFNDAQSVFEGTSKRLTAISEPRSRTLAESLNELGNQYQDSLQNAVQFVDQNQIAQARTEISRPRIVNVIARRDRLVNELQTQLNQNQATIREAQQFLRNLIILGTGATILATLLIGWLIASPLRQQLPKVVDSATAIAQGDLTQAIESSKDPTEVGQLLRSFQNMRESLNALIAQAQRSGIQISTSATQIAAAGRQLEATVNEQVASMNQVTATSRQIAATSGELAKAMDEVAETANTTMEAASNSQTNLDKIQLAMQHLIKSTGSISAQLRVMDEKANNINTVVTTITKVADQTNLLSLNAAIEAEKAGEYGAGFAVVAREIRRLADQAAVATLEIEQMVKGMQSSVSTGVIEVDKFSQEVSHYVTEVGDISGQITGFIDNVQGLTPRFEMVRQRMDEQYQGAEQISTAIAQLGDASYQTMQSLQETNNAIAQLDDAARGLQQEISQFKV